jgi:hypothetical protein
MYAKGHLKSMLFSEIIFRISDYQWCLITHDKPIFKLSKVSLFNTCIVVSLIFFFVIFDLVHSKILIKSTINQMNGCKVLNHCLFNAILGAMIFICKWFQ